MSNPAKGSYFSYDWNDWLHSQIFFREADTVLDADYKDTKNKGTPGRDKK